MNSKQVATLLKSVQQNYTGIWNNVDRIINSNIEGGLTEVYDELKEFYDDLDILIDRLSTIET